MTLVAVVVFALGFGGVTAAAAGQADPGTQLTSNTAELTGHDRDITAVAPADPQYNILNFNMAGGWPCLIYGPGVNGCVQGAEKAPFDPDRDKSPQELINNIEEHKPQVVLLQETCSDWMKSLEDIPGYTGKFRAVTKGSEQGEPATCKGDDTAEFGLGILIHENLADDTEVVYIGHQLGKDEGDDKHEYRKMLCAQISDRMMVACTAHAEGSSPAQHTAAAQALAHHYPEYTKYLGADLNRLPDTDPLTDFYHPAYLGMDVDSGRPGNKGAYKEVTNSCGNAIQESCGTGPETRPSRDGLGLNKEKIDYLFVSEWVTVNSFAVTEVQISDHKMMWVSVNFPSRAPETPVDTLANWVGFNSPYLGQRKSGILDGGTPNVYCRQWGAPQKYEGAENSWWMLTDLDSTEPGADWQLQWVSALALSRHGDNQAKDNDNDNLPLCAGSFDELS